MPASDESVKAACKGPRHISGSACLLGTLPFWMLCLGFPCQTKKSLQCSFFTTHFWFQHQRPLCYSSYKSTNSWENSWTLYWLLKKAGTLQVKTQAHRRIEAGRDLGRTQCKLLLKARPPLGPDKAAQGFIHSAPENLQGCKTSPALQFFCHSQHSLPHLPQVTDPNVNRGESQRSPPPALCLSQAPFNEFRAGERPKGARSPGSIIHCQRPSTVALPDTSASSPTAFLLPDPIKPYPPWPVLSTNL